MRLFITAVPLLCCAFAVPAAASPHEPTTEQPAAQQQAGTRQATVLQGGVARWSGADARECGIFGKRYAALDGTCYYPVDMKAKPGTHEVALYDAAGKGHTGSLVVEERECTETEITLDKLEYIDVSAENRARAAKERTAVDAAVKGAPDVHPRFTLPLGKPAAGAGVKDRSDFCEKRIYNGKVRSFHTGLDYLIGTGNPVVAPADGTVTLAADHFFAGNTVVVDHGGGLITMAFHLNDIAVTEGAQVKKGDKIGTVGETGRTTGPHLHFGARWQNQRIDAAALLGDPSKLPGIGEPEAGGDAPDVDAVEADAATPATEDRAGEDDNSAVKDD
jgi:murein DD-endopeptidase MepM/ murein hydrolase activator NlpD